MFSAAFRRTASAAAEALSTSLASASASARLATLEAPSHYAASCARTSSQLPLLRAFVSSQPSLSAAEVAQSAAWADSLLEEDEETQRLENTWRNLQAQSSSTLYVPPQAYRAEPAMPQVALTGSDDLKKVVSMLHSLQKDITTLNAKVEGLEVTLRQVLSKTSGGRS